MLSWVNKSRVAMILLLMMAMSTGCGQSGSKTTEVRMNNYLMTNGLAIIDEEKQVYVDDQGCEISMYLRQIQGLKDQTLEKEINQHIRDTATVLLTAEIPPYRGINVQVPEGSTLVEQQISVNVVGSYNNILSVNFYRNMSYRVPGELYWVSVGEVEVLNLDLNTGKEITLAELFPDGADYKTVVNQAVQAQLAKSNATEEGWYTMNDYKLVAPFVGIEDDQKFSLSYGDLVLHVDHQMPEFDVAFSSISMLIDHEMFQQLGPFAQRFYDPKADLYTGETPSEPHLLSTWPGEDRAIEWSDNGTKNFNSYIQARYSAAHPQVIQDKVKALAVADEEMIRQIQAAIPPEKYGHYEMQVRVYQCGDLYNISKIENGYDGTDNWFIRVGYVYDANTLEPLTLGDLFMPDFDYLAIIGPIIQQQLDDEGYQSYDSDQFMQQMSWTVESEGLGLYATIDKQSFYVRVPYNAFGMDNMVIFK